MKGAVKSAAYAAVRYLCNLSPYGLDKCVIGIFDRFLRAEGSKLFKAYARKELIKAVEGKNINKLKNNAAGRKLSFTNADGKKKTFDPFEFDKDTLSFTLPEATIE